MKNKLFIAGWVLLLLFECLRVYLIMPMPGSQEMQSIELAYFLGSNKLFIRLFLYALVAIPTIHIIRSGKKFQRILLVVALLIYAGVFYAFNFKMEADKMFYQPTATIMAGKKQNVIPLHKLVIGIDDQQQGRAYPIQLIGYHHQVIDTMNGNPMLVTYCTVCRTGRVYSALVNGKAETFRLVGMDHFNALFEDASTKSWWRQATGEAIAGPLKGMRLQEIPSEQVSLAVWMERHPETLVLQPDSTFADIYRKMDVYDQGRGKSALTKRDSSSWQKKSWVVGVENGTEARTYDWNLLVSHRMIQDSLNNDPIIILLDKDSASFHAYSRKLNGEVLHFEMKEDVLTDINTGSQWDLHGAAMQGSLKGAQLKKVSAYQEFLHSWEYFHPKSRRYRP